MNRITLARLLTALAFSGALAASSPAAAQKATMVRDIDRVGSAGAVMSCTASDFFRCTLAPAVPAGKRFVTSYASYVIYGNPTTMIFNAYIANGATNIYLPLFAPQVDPSGLGVYTAGTPLVAVFEAGDPPVFWAHNSPTLVANSMEITVLGHYECITTGPC